MNNELCNILGVSTSASVDEIHAAFRKKARQYHPDLGGDRQKFQELTDAYDELIRRKEQERRARAGQTIAPNQSTKPAEPLQKANPYASPSSAKPADTKSEKSAQKKEFKDGLSAARHLLTGKLPLQDQTTYFILVNALDIFLTHLHLRSGSYEANPIAAFFIRNWDMVGMVVYKMAIVALVCTIAQIVALTSIKKASWLLNFGTAFITAIVIYSIWLLVGY